MENPLEKASEYKEIVIFTHLNADPDAIGSAIALLEYFKVKKSRVKICAVEGVNALGRNLLKRLNKQVEINPDINKILDSCIIVLDSISASQLPSVDITKFKGLKILIDHHYANEEFKQLFDIAICKPEVTSTAEIIYELLTTTDFKLNRTSAIALSAGIITDTAHLQLATTQTFRIVADLLPYTNLEYIDLLKLIAIPIEPSRKIAHIKAASRLEIEKIDEWIIGLSHVSSFEASSARAIVKLGVDVAIVCAKKKNEVRISIRAGRTILKQSGLNFAKDIVPKLSQIVNGSGGGHVGAASITGTFEGNVEELLYLCRDALAELLIKKR